MVISSRRQLLRYLSAGDADKAAVEECDKNQDVKKP